MGKTPKPLSLLVHPEIVRFQRIVEDGKTFDELRAKGHKIVVMEDLADFDLILGPNAWRMTTETVHLLDVAILAARRKKYS